MDLHEELENAIGHGPALPAPQERLAAGRTALRRRRAVVAAGAAAAVVAVVLPVAAFSGGGPTSGRELAPAAPPAPAASASADDEPTEPAEERYRFSDDSVPAEVDYATLEPQIRPTAVVHERRADVLPGKKQESLALDVTWRGERYWVLLEWNEGGGGSTYTGPDDQFVDSFDEFVAQQVASAGMTTGPGGGGDGADEDFPEQGEVVGLAWEGDRLVASGDTEILDQRSDVDLGPSFAAENDTTGAALVQMAGERQLVLYRETEGDKGQLIAVLSDGHGDSLDALLAWAEQRYESGAGLL